MANLISMIQHLRLESPALLIQAFNLFLDGGTALPTMDFFFHWGLLLWFCLWILFF